MMIAWLRKALSRATEESSSQATAAADIADSEPASTPEERHAVARRVYPQHGVVAVLGYSDAEKAEIILAMTRREQAMLAQWEREHPKPSYGRDWARAPEDDYE